MEKFDFNDIGKKLPYTVKNDFFDDIEVRILSEIRKENEKRKSGFRRQIKRYSTVAAAIAVTVISTLFLFEHNPSLEYDKTDFSEIAQAFSDLSEEDQAYLLETYQEDTFLNEE